MALARVSFLSSKFARLTHYRAGQILTTGGNAMTDFDDFLKHLDDVPAEKIPAVVAQLAAAQGMLLARLLENGNGNGTHAKGGDVLLDVYQAAEIIACKVDWLYRRSRTLPFVVRAGGKLLFSSEGIQRWMKKPVSKKNPIEAGLKVVSSSDGIQRRIKDSRIKNLKGSKKT